MNIYLETVSKEM